MNENFLSAPLAKRLYEHVASLPILDYHNHLCVADLFHDRTYATITEMWIATDPYKHRAMRILGVPEQKITQSQSAYETFSAFCGIFPMLAGNPIYDWAAMELQTLFGTSLLPSPATCDKLWELTNTALQNGLSAKKLLGKFRVEYNAPCATLTDDLSCFSKADGLCPSLRGDTIVFPDRAFLQTLEHLQQCPVASLDDYFTAIAHRMDAFAEAGCVFADHAWDDTFCYFQEDGKNDARFQRLYAGELLSGNDRMALASCILRFLAGIYAKRRMVLQLHIGAMRQTSARLRQIAGVAGGFAGIGSPADVRAIRTFLNDVESASSGLPRVILFPLNPTDTADLAILSGSFCRDGEIGTITLGPAWWWCDHANGIRRVLTDTMTYSVLSVFPGMVTDSRSIASFVRHDYFRRILCAFLAREVADGTLPNDETLLCEIAYAICYGNAKRMLCESGGFQSYNP